MQDGCGEKREACNPPGEAAAPPTPAMSLPRTDRVLKGKYRPHSGSSAKRRPALSGPVTSCVPAYASPCTTPDVPMLNSSLYKDLLCSARHLQSSCQKIPPEISSVVFAVLWRDQVLLTYLSHTASQILSCIEFSLFISPPLLLRSQRIIKQWFRRGVIC